MDNLPPSIVRRNKGFLIQLEREFRDNEEEYITNPLDRPPEEDTNSLDGPPIVYNDLEFIYTPREFLNILYVVLKPHNTR